MSEENNKKKMSNSKKVLLGVLSIFLVILLAISLTFTYFSSKVNRVEIDRNFVTDTGQEPLKEDKDVITVALFGSDYANGYGASDSTMILAIDTKNNKIKLMSLMRDIYLDLPDGGKQNLNYTMVEGGPAATLKTINYNFNLAVDKFVHVSLETLPVIIDALGGIELNITDEEVLYINQYIDNINKENGTSSPHITYSGTQHLDGTQASAYCRIRYTSGGDYKRTERQRDVLEIIFTKFKDINVVELPGLANDLLPYVTTNMLNSELLSIATKALSLGVNNIEQARFPLDEHHTTEWTDMYHMVIDKEATTNEIHNFLYSLD